MQNHRRHLFALCAAVALSGGTGGLRATPAPKAMSMPSATPSASSSKAAAKAARAAPVRIENAWVRAAPPGTDMLAGYMDVRNVGNRALRLVAADSDAFGLVELHRSLMSGGMSSMRPAGAQDIPAGGSLQIHAGGLHWMLMEPRHDLKVGDAVAFTLHFADGSVARAVARVAQQAPASTGTSNQVCPGHRSGMINGSTGCVGAAIQPLQ
ncbi:MAG: copper chaperone PCu(A)C [Proteobacteria bacterium]|nr:copper chaperone PCu(A)C [Pseudomonadota bacterium]